MSGSSCLDQEYPSFPFVSHPPLVMLFSYLRLGFSGSRYAHQVERRLEQEHKLVLPSIDTPERVIVVGKETDQCLNNAHIARYPRLVAVACINGFACTAQNKKMFAVCGPVAGRVVLVSIVLLVPAMVVRDVIRVVRVVGCCASQA